MQPYQTPEEEIWNAITHGIGLLLAIAMLVIVVVFSHGVWKTVSVSIYGATLVLLYLASTLYHALPVCKNLFNKFDHSAIYLLIAGSYTPILLVTLRGPIGWTFFGIIWGLAILGVVYKSIYGDRHIIFSTIIYLVMGWLVVLFFQPLVKVIAPISLLFLIIGGLCYTIGVIFFALKGKYMHLIWHLFVLAGSICHFFAMLWI